MEVEQKVQEYESTIQDYKQRIHRQSEQLKQFMKIHELVQSMTVVDEGLGSAGDI